MLISIFNSHRPYNSVSIIVLHCENFKKLLGKTLKRFHLAGSVQNEPHSAKLMLAILSDIIVVLETVNGVLTMR